MSTKPTEYLNWDPSQSNVIDPPSGLKSTGYLPGVDPASQHHNWIFNLCDQWIQWLDGVTSISTVSVSTTYAIASGVGTVLANPSSGTFAVSLPSAASTSIGTRFTIKNTAIGSSNSVTVTPNGTDDIEGANSSVSLGAGEYITLVSDGSSNYWQVG